MDVETMQQNTIIHPAAGRRRLTASSLRIEEFRHYSGEPANGTFDSFHVMAFPTILIVSFHSWQESLKRFQLRASAKKQFQHGFSLPELLITLAVGSILAATGILMASTATNEVRLSTSGTNYVNLLQAARMRAVRDDAFYQVLVDCGTLGTAAPCTGTTP